MPKLRSPLCLATILLLACGGDQPPVPDPDGTLGAGGATLPARPADEGREGTRDDGTADDGSAGDGSPDASSVAPSDTEPWVAETPPDGGAPNPHPWVTGTSRGGTPSTTAPLPILMSVRSARHDGYDRVVFEFDRRLPEWRAEYIDSPQYECGSGEAVRLEGGAWLQVSFEMANAHTEQGRPTQAPRHVADPDGAVLRELRRTCDFEGQVVYVLGVASRTAYRAFPLSTPARLVLDVRR